MPAFKYRTMGGVALKTHHPDKMASAVEVVGSGGSLRWLPWYGFICEQGARIVGSGFSKMHALAISSGDGGPDSQWRILETGETVKCLWTPVKQHGTTTYVVHVVIDGEGWPVVVKEPAKLDTSIEPGWLAGLAEI